MEHLIMLNIICIFKFIQLLGKIQNVLNYKIFN